MSETRFTLCDLFDIKEQVQLKKEELTKNPSFAQIKQKMSEQKGKSPLLAKFSEQLIPLILGKLDELLDIDIFQDILGSTWSQQKGLAKYADSEQYHSRKTVLIPILEHSLDSEHNPSVEPTIGGINMGKIHLQVEASFVINGVILEICNARIMKLHLDGILGGGTIKLSGVPFLEKESDTLDLPGTIDLGEGISLFAKN